MSFIGMNRNHWNSVKLLPFISYPELSAGRAHDVLRGQGPRGCAVRARVPVAQPMPWGTFRAATALCLPSSAAASMAVCSLAAASCGGAAGGWVPKGAGELLEQFLGDGVGVREQSGSWQRGPSQAAGTQGPMNSCSKADHPLDECSGQCLLLGTKGPKWSQGVGGQGRGGEWGKWDGKMADGVPHRLPLPDSLVGGMLAV